MKLKNVALLVVAVMASSVSVYGQGLILDNLGNSGAINAATGGRVFVNGVLFDGINANVGVEVFGGPNAGSLTSMGTFTQGNDSKGYTGADIGQFQLGTAFSVVTVPGVAAGGTATIQLNMWFNGTTPGGLYANYAAASAPGAGFAGTVLFTNPTSNPGGQPPVPAGNLSGMPSINLVVTPVPEPATVALVGLGAAALLAFRRRK